MNTSLLVLVLAGLAPVSVAQIKTPRPLPPPGPDKFVDESLVPRPLPVGLARGAVRPGTSKPLPAGAPQFEKLNTTRPDLMIDEPGDGRVWVRGLGYKASFGSEGATIVPFLGSDAPRNMPVRLSIASARAGNRDIELAPAGNVHHDGQHIVIDRGAASEVYDVTKDNIEQTFVLDSLPTRGALHLEIAVESDLVARETADGIELSNERGGVRCGRTTVLDADHARADMPTRLVNGRIHVDVPESFVRTARLPLRVDPIWTTYQIITTTPDQYFSDVAYDGSSGNWCVVWQEVYSLNDNDVYALMVYSNQIVPNSTSEIDYTTDFWREPKVANNSLADNFLVVATAFPAGTGNAMIKGRIRDAGTVAMGPQTVYSGSDGGTKTNADVGGDPVIVGPTYYFVVWQHNISGTDTDIQAQLVNSDGTPHGLTIPLDVSAFTLDGAPRISKSDGNEPYATQEWNIVWQRTDQFSTVSDIRGAQVHWDGNITSPSFSIDNSASYDTNPVASPPLERPNGELRPWMVAWERDMGGQHDLFGQVLEGAVTKAADNLTALVAITVGEDQLNPELECDGVQFAMSFRETFLNNAQDYDIILDAFWFADDTIGVSEGHQLLDFSSQNSYLPRIASQNSAGLALGGAFVCTWTTLNSSFDIYAGQYFAPTNGPAHAYCFGDGSGTACPCSAGLYGNGCPSSVNPSGANLSGTGFHWGIVDSFVLTASGMPTNASCLFFQGTTAANGGLGAQFGDGLRCVGGAVIRLGAKTAQGGVASYPELGDQPITVKGGIGQPGGVRKYQAWYRNADPTFCTASTFNLTNGYDVVWLP